MNRIISQACIALAVLSITSCEEWLLPRQDNKWNDPQKVEFTQRKLDVTPGYALPEGVHEVDLGLSVKWADMNVGSQGPEDGLHGFFAWGEIASKPSYSWQSYEWGDSRSLTRYSFDRAGVINDVEKGALLDSHDDVAFVQWGEGWRMPTPEEFRELFENTTKEVNLSRKTVRLTASNGNSIILPVHSFMLSDGLQTECSVVSIGYWTSKLSLFDSAFAYQAVTEIPGWSGEGRYDDEYVGKPEKISLSCGTGGAGSNRAFGLYVRPVHE